MGEGTPSPFVYAKTQAALGAPGGTQFVQAVFAIRNLQAEAECLPGKE
jgi:hypothetical protein